MSGSNRTSDNISLSEVYSLVESSPESAITHIDQVLMYLTDGDSRTQKEAAEVIRKLADSEPKKTADYFDGIVRNAYEGDLEIQLLLIKASNQLRGYVPDEQIWYHREILLSILENRSEEYEVLESIAGLLYSLARYDAEAVIPHIDIVASLLYSDVQEATKNALYCLECIAEQDAGIVSKYAEELFQIIEHSIIPEENKIALSILGHIVANCPNQIDTKRFQKTIRSLATSNNKYVVKEATNEIGKLISTNQENSESLIDIVARNLHSSDAEVRKQAMIECLRITNYHPKLLKNTSSINENYTTNRIKELKKEFNYNDSMKESSRVADDVRVNDGIDD